MEFVMREGPCLCRALNRDPTKSAVQQKECFDHIPTFSSWPMGSTLEFQSPFQKQ